MKRLFPLFLLICFCISSCIELTEHIHFNKDGSGTATISVKVWGTINEAELGEVSKEDLAAMDGMLHYDTKTLIEKAEEIKAIPGIVGVEYNIKASFDPARNDVSTVSFQFDSVSTLNKALVSLYNTQDKKENRTTLIILQNEGSKEISRSFVTFFYKWDAQLSHFAELYNKGTDGDYYSREPYSNAKINYHYTFDYPVKTSELNTIDSVANNSKEVIWKANASILRNSPLQVSNSFLPTE